MAALTLTPLSLARVEGDKRTSRTRHATPPMWHMTATTAMTSIVAVTAHSSRKRLYLQHTCAPHAPPTPYPVIPHHTIPPGTETMIRKARGDKRDALGYAGAGLFTGVAMTFPIGESLPLGAAPKRRSYRWACFASTRARACEPSVLGRERRARIVKGMLFADRSRLDV